MPAEDNIPEPVAVPPCSACGRVRHSYHTINDVVYCDYCVIWCPSCEDGPVPLSSARYIVNDYYCEDHRPTCSSCGRSDADELYDSSGDLICGDCAPRCVDCGNMVFDGDNDSYDEILCTNCSRGELRYYGKTHPTTWYGAEDNEAPDEESGLYFLGIELEVWAERNFRLRPIREWSENSVFGNRSALDLKEDGSVHGFEIVTQPMTPEFFESVDWDSFFEMLNRTIPAPDDEEPDSHGLHVHISRSAFRGDDVALASFAYLLGADDSNMVRIGRRRPTGYCMKTEFPVSEAILSTSKATSQYYKIRGKGIRQQRGAINLTNHSTIEIRAPKSTRDPDELRNTVRMVYMAAEYVMSLRSTNHGFIPPKALHWDRFSAWVQNVRPEFYDGLAKP